MALLPEEAGAALLFGLGRLGMALIPEIGALPEALAVDAIAGEAIAGTAAGAAAGTFFSKLMAKVGLFNSTKIAEIAGEDLQAIKNVDARIISSEKDFFSKAKLIDEHNPYNMGELPQKVQRTFMGGSYKSYVLNEDVILYRAGSIEESLGQYFSFEKPVSELQVRVDKALRNIWNENNISIIETGYALKVPKGTMVHVGEIAPQGEIFLGGTKQIFIKAPWNIPGVQVLEKFPLQEELLWNQIARASLK